MVQLDTQTDFMQHYNIPKKVQIVIDGGMQESC